jgi:hypothetical protein
VAEHALDKDAVVTTIAAAPTVAVEDRNDAGDDND